MEKYGDYMELTLTIPTNIYLAMKIPEPEIEKTLLLELAISLYKRNILSFGKSRELAQMSKWDFHDELGKRKIERHYTMECIEEDIKYAKNNF